jgi:predicted phosphoribosyltransferase
MFKDRDEAGKLLATKLKKYQINQPIVLAIPKGGVEVGIHISRFLGCEFSLIIVRKLGYLKQPEIAFGALGEDGTLYLNPNTRVRLSKQEIESVISREKKRIEQSLNRYRKGEPLPSLMNRVVILADDGVATGSTIFAAIEMIKKQKPEKIIVATPVIAFEVYEKMLSKVNEIIVLRIAEDLAAVSDYYENFRDVTNEKMDHLLKKNEIKNKLLKTLSL